MWLNSLRDLTMLVFGLLKRFWNQFTKKTVLKYWLISFMWPKNVMNITIYILNMPSFLPYKVLHFLGKTSVLIINFYQKRYQCKKYLCETNVGQFLRFGSYNFLCLDSKFLNQWIDFYWRFDKNNDYFNIFGNITKFMFSFILYTIFFVKSKCALQSFEKFSFSQLYWKQQSTFWICHRFCLRKCPTF